MFLRPLAGNSIQTNALGLGDLLAHYHWRRQTQPLGCTSAQRSGLLGQLYNHLVLDLMKVWPNCPVNFI